MCAEQFNVSIRYFDKEYVVHKDSISLFRLSFMNAATTFSAIEVILIRTCLPMTLCRGQAYDGAANMLGNRSSVAACLQQEEPVAIPVHCLEQSLSLCLQGTGQKITAIRDAIDVVKEVAKLVNYSPKRNTLFQAKALEGKQPGAVLTTLCLTCWTVRTAALLESILDQHSILMGTMLTVNTTTPDEYGMKGDSALNTLEKFATLFGLRLGHLFSAAEETSRGLQAKDTSVQEALPSVSILHRCKTCQRSHTAYDAFYGTCAEIAISLKIEKPILPRYSR